MRMDCSQCQGNGRVTLSLVGGGELKGQSVAHIQCPWCNGTGMQAPDTLQDASGVTEDSPPSHLTTVEHFFAGHLRQLLNLLQLSRGLPFVVYQAWGGRLSEIDIKHPEHGLSVMNDIMLHFWELKRELVSGDLLSHTASPRSIVLNQELGAIKRQLDWLEVILQYLHHRSDQQQWACLNR